MSSHKVFIGICNSQDVVPADFFWSFINIKHQGPITIFRSRHPWDVVRNNLIIYQFLRSDCDILAKMDIDQKYPSDYFERLIPIVEKHKVAGPMIFDRWEQNNYMPLAFSDVRGFKPIPMNIDGLKGIVTIPYPHTNLLYHREVLEKIPAPWYEAHLQPDGLERANHVDFTFIGKIHKAGYEIYIDLDLCVGHLHTIFVGRKEHEDRRNQKVL